MQKGVIENAFLEYDAVANDVFFGIVVLGSWVQRRRERAENGVSGEVESL